MAETYTSGVAAMKELASTMQRKASSDLEHINVTISSQTMAVEHVCDRRKINYFYNIEYDYVIFLNSEWLCP